MPGRMIALAIAACGWLGAGLIAVMLVASAGFGVICVIGLMVWFVAARIDSRRDDPLRTRMAPHLMASQRERFEDDVSATWYPEPSLAQQTVRGFRHLGMALTLIGAGGLIWFQLLHQRGSTLDEVIARRDVARGLGAGYGVIGQQRRAVRGP